MDEKLSLLSELIRLASSDSELREREYDFLLSIARGLGIEKEAFDKLFEKHIDFRPPKSEFDRILQFHRLVLLMNIDGESSPEELDQIRDTGIRMGLSPDSTEQVLEMMERFENRVIPPETLIAVFKKQYN